MDSLVKPILEVVNSTQHTITVKWETEYNNLQENEFLSYKVQIQDPVYKWITKYWGLSKEAIIKDLAPQHVYNIRLGVIYMFGEIWSENITAATKLGQQWTYFMFKAIETLNPKNLESFLSNRSKAVKAMNRYGETPLMQAARLGNVECAKLLLKAGSDPNSTMFPSLQTPLMAASFAGHKVLAALLVNHGANWLERDLCGRNALHYAVSNSQLETVKMALDGGCDVNSRDNSNWTPLMRAVILGAKDNVLTELLSRGGDVEQRDEHGNTCIDIARLHKNERIILLVTKRDEEEAIKEEKDEIPEEETEEHDNQIC